MALIKCIECEKSISDKSVNCPECGCPTKYSSNPQNESGTKNNETELNDLLENDENVQEQSYTETTSKEKSMVTHKGSVWIRLLSKYIDLQLYTVIIYLPIAFIIYYFWRYNLFDTLNGYVILPILILIFVDSILIALFGTTPGRWLLNIRIIKNNGQKLNYIESLQRSVLLFTTGFALGFSFLLPFTGIYSLFRLIKRGNTIWDLKTNSVVIHERINNVRILFSLIIVVLLAAINHLFTRFIITYPFG